MIKCFTDGSCRANGSDNAPGAWGFIVVDDNNQIIHTAADGFTPATNNRAELLAIINACEWVAAEYDNFTDIQIISDSAYCLNALSQHWYLGWQRNGWITSKKTPVLNKDLWERLIPFFEKANFSFMKTRGHDSDLMNNMVDAMVQSITEKMK